MFRGLGHHNESSRRRGDVGESVVGEVTRLFAKQNIHDVPPERLQAVSPEDRVESLQDVHGVLDLVEETPDLVDEKMHELKLALSQPQGTSTWTRSRVGDEEGYEEAMRQNPTFVEGQLLKSLRADGFDVQRARYRVRRYFQTKLEFFGTETLGRDLELQDLNEEERRLLNEGGVQFIKKRDSRGRAILVQFSRICWRYPLESVTKLLFWATDIVSRDEVSQKRGLVFVHHGINVGIPKSELAKVQNRGQRMVAIIPCMTVRFAAVHCCTDDPSGLSRFSVAARFLESRYLCRFLTHYGTDLECRYNLMTFGLPEDAFPINDDGSISTESHRIWLYRLEEAEKSGSKSSSRPSPIELITKELQPGPLDIIMGRGLRGKKAPGNQLFKRILESYQPQYDAAIRYAKGKIVEKVYKEMKEMGCRFLAPIKVNERFDTTYAWAEVNEEAAVDRISHGFRNRRLTSKTK